MVCQVSVSHARRCCAQLLRSRAASPQPAAISAACCLCNSLPIHAHARAAYVPDCAMQAPGMVVHVSAGHHSGTLVNALMHRLGMPAVDLSAAAAAAGAGTGSGKEEGMSDSSSLCCQHTLEVRSEYCTAPLHIPTVLHYCTYPQYCRMHIPCSCSQSVLPNRLRARTPAFSSCMPPLTCRVSLPYSLTSTHATLP